MSTHNICFRREIRKLFALYPLLSRPDTCLTYSKRKEFTLKDICFIEKKHPITSPKRLVWSFSNHNDTLSDFQ